jgi:tRNA(adenine34) deaminase
MAQARIARLVYAAADPKTGAVSMLGTAAFRRRTNHRFDVVRGVLAEPAGEILRAFFRARRI